MAGNDFQDHLRALLDRVPAARAAVLADRDGIAVASASRDASLEADVLAARFAVVLRELRGALERLGQGEPTQVTLDLREARIAILPLKEGFALYVILEADSPLGRSLFEALKAAPGLEAGL